MSGDTWDRSVFDRLYAASDDPWDFRSSAYEQAKYAATLEMLPPGRFGRALEIGCSIGVLTAQLAARCDSLVAIDCAPAALSRAASTCASLGHVRFEPHHVPASFPAGRYDLIVISEVLYFLAGHDIARLAARCEAALLPGGTVILVNWTGPTDTPCTGEDAADAFRAASRLTALPPRRGTTFRMDRLIGPVSRSGSGI